MTPGCCRMWVLRPYWRGAEWAAIGRVTQKVPKDFPTANVLSYRADLAAMDPTVAANGR